MHSRSAPRRRHSAELRAQVLAQCDVARRGARRIARPALALRHMARGHQRQLSSRFAALRVRAAHRDYLDTRMRGEEWLLISR